MINLHRFYFYGKVTFMSEEYLNIGDASKLLGVSIDTLRRWDESGKFKATRTSGGHRTYREHDIEIFLNDLSSLALEWVSLPEPLELPSSFYCPINPIFQARLVKLQTALKSDPSTPEYFSLLVAIAGEIGNNSFDHNIGNWPDLPGVFFAFDTHKRQIVLADRGQGILQTLKRVRPGLPNHTEALRVAFTEILSGREPEARGNGLKFVRKIIQDYPINLVFQTGDASLHLKEKQKELAQLINPIAIHGCLAIITY